MRNTEHALADIPNVGPATVRDFHLLGITTPKQLKSADAMGLYDRLCRITGVRHDPCVIDVFQSAIHFVNGGRPKPWWAFTAERKRSLNKQNKGTRKK